jgi:hypothetical protein
MMTKREPVKVVVVTESDDSVDVETPWAFPVSPNVFELDNLPFYAYGLSLGDHFVAEPTDDDPRPHFVRIVRKSGNRTIRVIFDPPVDESAASKAILDHIVSLGCSFEGANPGYIVVNIPEDADFDAVCAYATAASVEWEHADPTYDDLYPDG